MLRSSWLPSANRPGADFPLENLPYGAFEAEGGGVHLGVAIGDQILDLHAAAHAPTPAGVFADLPAPLAAACSAPVLNPLMALGPAAAAQLRARLTELLCESPSLPAESVHHWLRPQAGAVLRLPVAIGDYTDFYASLHHAVRAGALFRPDLPLHANYKHLPVAYHGRASSIVVSPQPVRRPLGQRPPGQAGATPDFGPSRQLDYELEVGCFIGRGNHWGEPIPLARAEEYIFGFCLSMTGRRATCNAGSRSRWGRFWARASPPPSLPWVVTREALEPFRARRVPRPPGDPEPLPYLDDPDDRQCGALDVYLVAELSSSRMRQQDLPPMPISRVNLRGLYWTPAQMIAHHTSNGCNLRPGDLLASGTVSGPEPDACGCLLERTAGGAVPGQRPLLLPSGERRAFLDDGDEVVLRAHCQRPGAARIGWGECRGQIVSAAAPV